MRDLQKNIRVFCLYDNKSELDFFLTSTFSQTEVQRYLIILSNSDTRLKEVNSSLKNGFSIISVNVPKTITSKWKNSKFSKILDEIFSDFPKTKSRQNFFVDFSSIRVTKGFVEYIESVLVGRLKKIQSKYSLFFLFLEKKISKKLANQLVMNFPFLCLKGAQIHPNFYYNINGISTFPSNIKDLYQPIQLLIEELERVNLEQDSLNKELFLANTHNNVLEASLATMLTLEKEELGVTPRGTPADILSLLQHKDLKQRYEQKTQILSTVIHDIKSPLAAIQGFAEILRDGLVGNVTPEMQKHLQVIVSNSKRLARMVDSLLEYDSYDISDYLTQKETFDLIELIQDAKMAILPQMIQNRQSVESYTPDKLEMIGNRELLLRVLQNILDNAIKYSPQEKGKVELFTEEKTRKGQKVVRIIIKDNGFGFDKKNIKNAFEPFTRFEPGSTSTGLGLSITKKIVEDIHGGTIEISSPGRQKGTTVTIILPKI